MATKQAATVVATTQEAPRADAGVHRVSHNVRLSAARPAPADVPGPAGPPGPPARPALQLARSHAQRPLARTELVKAEFVFADPPAADACEIVLHGDWDDWAGKAMRREEPGLWSVVCVVPTGHRRFGFCIDGEWTISQRHPREEGARVNWRDVLGPRRMPAQRSAFYRWARDTLEGFGVVAMPDAGELPGLYGRRIGPAERVTRMEWGTVVVAAAVVYLFACAVYGLLFGSV